jgi:hypothetical protein
VGGLCYGNPNGVATNPAAIDNYEAQYFYDTIVSPLAAGAAQLVNQSFTFGPVTASLQQAIDATYDNYAATYNTLFCSGSGNGGTVAPPATAYNGLGVGAYGGLSSAGPTADNGRAKPDLTAPGEVTSFSTPLVVGAAALLQQAGARGDGGSDSRAATDARTIKALLLNSAVKPGDWATTNGSPLDPRYGAGILNVFNAYSQLTGGQHGCSETTQVPAGGAHAPGSGGGVVASARGWDFSTNTSSPSNDGVSHYYFDLSDPAATAYTATATLVWQKQANKAAINDLNLYLYDRASGSLMAASTSAVDNVEHLWVPQLPPGRYDLQVWKAGGGNPGKRVSNSEAYAVAFDFFALALTVEPSGSQLVLSWPLYPAGFVLQSASQLDSAATWSPVVASITVTNGQNRVVLNDAAGRQFYRLRRP